MKDYYKGYIEALEAVQGYAKNQLDEGDFDDRPANLLLLGWLHEAIEQAKQISEG